MKQIIRVLIVTVLFIGAYAIAPSGCSNNNTTWLTQAFGDYIRSIEGQKNLEEIPKLIIAGRDKWLPKGEKWDALAAEIIRQYVAANPQNDAAMNKVLEDLAMQLNTKR